MRKINTLKLISLIGSMITTCIIPIFSNEIKIFLIKLFGLGHRPIINSINTIQLIVITLILWAVFYYFSSVIYKRKIGKTEFGGLISFDEPPSSDSGYLQPPYFDCLGGRWLLGNSEIKGTPICIKCQRDMHHIRKNDYGLNEVWQCVDHPEQRIVWLDKKWSLYQEVTDEYNARARQEGFIEKKPPGWSSRLDH